MIGHAPLPPPRWKVRYVFTHGFRPRSFEFSRPRNHGVSKNACPPPPSPFVLEGQAEGERERETETPMETRLTGPLPALRSRLIYSVWSAPPPSSTRYRDTRGFQTLSLSLFRALLFLNSFNSRIPCIELGSSSLVIIHRSFPLLSREHAAISNRPRVSDCPFARQMARRKEEEKEEEKSVGEMPSIHPSIHPPRR